MSQPQRRSEPVGAEETKPGLVPPPMWAIAVLGILVYLAFFHFIEKGAAFDANVYGRFGSFTEVGDVHPPPDRPIDFIQGRILYRTYCASCHGNGGAGGAGFPPLAKSDWVNVDGHQRLIRIVLGGLQGPITVNGVGYNGNMLAWGSQLTDEQVAHVLGYVRNEWGNKGSYVTVDEVKAIRAKEASRAEQWTAAELLAIPLQAPE